MRRPSKTPTTFWIMLTWAIFFVAGFHLIAYSPPRYGECEKVFSSLDWILIWRCLVGFQTANWSIFLIVLAQNLPRFLKPYFHRQPIHLAGTIMVTLLLLLGMSKGGVSLQAPLYNFQIKLWILNFIGFLISLLAGLGIWLIQIALQRLIDGEKRSDERKITRFLELREALQLFLFIAGTNIGAAVLATGALRQAIQQFKQLPTLCNVTPISMEQLMIYGVLLSAILALAYLPTYQTLVEVGHDLCKDLCPMPEFQKDGWNTWHTKRKSLEEILKLDASFKDNFETSLFIFAPLASSFISILLGKA